MTRSQHDVVLTVRSCWISILSAVLVLTNVHATKFVLTQSSDEIRGAEHVRSFVPIRQHIVFDRAAEGGSSPAAFVSAGGPRNEFGDVTQLQYYTFNSGSGEYELDSIIDQKELGPFTDDLGLDPCGLYGNFLGAIRAVDFYDVSLLFYEYDPATKVWTKQARTFYGYYGISACDIFNEEEALAGALQDPDGYYTPLPVSIFKRDPNVNDGAWGSSGAIFPPDTSDEAAYFGEEDVFLVNDGLALIFADEDYDTSKGFRRIGSINVYKRSNPDSAWIFRQQVFWPNVPRSFGAVTIRELRMYRVRYSGSYIATENSLVAFDSEGQVFVKSLIVIYKILDDGGLQQVQVLDVPEVRQFDSAGLNYDWARWSLQMESNRFTTAILTSDRSQSVIVVYERDDSDDQYKLKTSFPAPSADPDTTDVYEQCQTSGFNANRIFVSCSEVTESRYKQYTTFVYSEDDSPCAVTSFTLVDSETDEDIRPLVDGDTIDAGSHLNIRANVEGDVESVVFDLNARIAYRIEDEAPFALGGDFPTGDYSDEPFLNRPRDSYTLTAYPYTEEGGQGSIGDSLSISFAVV